MKYDKKIVTYIDILGFKNIINKTMNNGAVLEELRSYFLNFIDIGNELHTLKNDFAKNEKIDLSPDNFYLHWSDFSITVASDLLFISVKAEGYEVLLEILQGMQLDGALKGYFLRSGMVFGEIIHSGNMVFGPAVNQAVELEKDSIYPRIIIENNTHQKILEEIKRYLEKTKGLGFQNKNIFSFLKNDKDEYLYVDYIPNEDDMILKLKKSLDRNIAESKESDELSKIIWKMDWIQSKIKDLEQNSFN